MVNERKDDEMMYHKKDRGITKNELNMVDKQDMREK